MQAGERHCRAQRGLATRPSVAQVFSYREQVDEAMHRLIERVGGDAAHPASQLIELGLHHEQQHQELLVTDIKRPLSEKSSWRTWLNARCILRLSVSNRAMACSATACGEEAGTRTTVRPSARAAATSTLL